MDSSSNSGSGSDGDRGQLLGREMPAGPFKWWDEERRKRWRDGMDQGGIIGCDNDDDDDCWLNKKSKSSHQRG